MGIIKGRTQDVIENAAKALKNGDLVAFPTETVYGLGADATNENAVSKIYKVKGRPTDHPIIVHISSLSKMEDWAVDIPDYAIKLAADFWPGPMTLILRRSTLAKDFITGGQDKVGLRVPNQSLALALLKKFEALGGSGVAAPSANRYRAISPTNADAVASEIGVFLGTADFILDGGQCFIGIESTIIDCTNESPAILRPGAIGAEEIRVATTLSVVSLSSMDQIRAPGLQSVHYCPRAEVVLGRRPREGEGFLAMNGIPTPRGVVRLASPKNVEEFAKILYEALRLGDKLNLNTIIVFAPEPKGLGLAIQNRLEKMKKFD